MAIMESRKVAPVTLEKSPTGISGLDDVTGGGLPRGRTTLVCGSPGCGKTLLALEFLIHGAQQFGEPGVMMAFEETEGDLAKNISSLGVNLDRLTATKRLLVDHVHIERSEIEETGVYDLEGLFVRLGYAIDSIGAKRVAIDTIETLFSGLSDEHILRAEIRRLFHWLKKRGVTAVVTAERGEGSLTRYGLEEYVSDCVILLDHRVNEQISTRRLRIVKYRGSGHGTNEFPFLIDEHGISVLPITSAGLDHPASDERISSGIAALDEMLGGRGYYSGSSILISGTAGTGKTSIASQFVKAACDRGQRAMYFAFEESAHQLVRNMRSIGLDLQSAIDRGLLQIHATRPTRYGLELHLVRMHKLINDFQPDVVVVDPVSNFIATGTMHDAASMLVRLIDFLKNRGTTCLLTNLASGMSNLEETEVGISSIIDTWVLLRDLEEAGQRSGSLYVLKSRGMPHSRQVRKYRITDHGIEIQPPAEAVPAK